MAKATSGWMPTMTVFAPRSRIMWATSLSVRVENESMTSSAVTSMMTPRERDFPTFSTIASRSWTRSASCSAVCIVAIKKGPCLRMGTSISHPSLNGLRLGAVGQLGHDAVPEEPLRLLDPPLEVADRRHLRELDADVDQGLSDLGREP